MAVYSGEQLLPLIQPHGRTWFDQQSQGIWFNWTCSGFTVTFTGKTLRAKILAFGDVIPIPGAHPKRLLVELSPASTDTKNRNTLTIEEARHQYTPEYIALTKDFYLKM